MSAVGVLRFPGTNCDRDVWQAIEQTGNQPQWLWFKDRFDYKDYKAFVIPGGFSYGDYLRSGALAALSPAMESVKEAAAQGWPVFGICNGFQILCEAGLLPGALLRNDHGRFIDHWVDLELINEGAWSPYEKKSYRMPLAHADGRFFVNEEQRKEIHDNGQVWLTYKENPNGSVDSIAGVMNKEKNVAGMMPHPDRALQEWMGSCDGLNFFNWSKEV